MADYKTVVIHIGVELDADADVDELAERLAKYADREEVDFGVKAGWVDDIEIRYNA